MNKARSGPRRRDAKYDAFISYSRAWDEALAVAVQRGLARFAKRQRQLRALRIFRDEASLSANPGLWPSIEAALAGSAYFIVFASPEAAASTWVQRELDYWWTNKPTDHVLIALTGGTIEWDDATGDYDWDVTDALPASFRNRIATEPRYVDLRWAHTEADLSLQHPRFRDAVADLAATLHERDKDELIGEDVRLRRRAVRVTRAVIATLSALVILIAVLAVFALVARDRADDQRRLATSRFLAAAARDSLDRNLDRAALLSVESLALEDTAEGRSSLLLALQRAPDAQRYLQTEGPEINNVAMSADGQQAAAVSSDGALTVWDAPSGRLLARAADAHNGGALAVAYSPTDELLATGGADGTLAIWDTQTLELLRRLEVKEPAVRSVAFSPDGALLVAGGGEATQYRSIVAWDEMVPRRIEIWDVARWQRLAALNGHAGAVEQLQFSADGRKLFSANIDFDTGLIVWDVGPWTGQWLSFPERRGLNSGMTVNTDGTLLAVASNLYDVVVVWDVAANALVRELTNVPGRVSDLAFSPDDAQLLASTNDGAIVAWDSSDLTRPFHRLADHDRNIEGGGTLIAFGSATALVSGSSGGDVIVHDTAATSRLITGEPRAVSEQISRVTVIGNGNGDFALDPGNGSREVTVWRADASDTVATQRFSEDTSTWQAALHPAGSLLTVAVKDGDSTVLELVDMRNGAHVWRVGVEPNGTASSADGSLLAIADADANITVVDTASGVVRRRFDARPVVPEELQIQQTLDIIVQPATTALAFSPDNRVLAAAVPDGPVWLWNVDNGILAAPEPLTGHGRVESLAFSPDGRILATGGDDEQIRLWDVATGQLIGRTADRPQGRVYDLMFSPDGKTLLSSSPEHELWDLESRQRIGAPLAVSDPLGAAAFNATGDELVVVGSNGEVRRVDLSIESWRDIACVIANRELTPSESRQFLGQTEVIDRCTRPS